MPETTSTPAWAAQLPDNLKGNADLTGFQTIGDLGGAYVELKGRSGELEGKMKDALFLPGNDATEETRNQFYEKLGRPKTPEEYTVKKPGNLPDGMPYREAGEKKFRQAVHKLGLNDAQASGLYDLYHADAVEEWNALQSARMDSHNKAVKTLQDEWGNDYKGNAEKAMRVAALGGEEFKNMLDQSGLGDHPVFVRYLFNLFDRIGEDSIGIPGPRSGKGEALDLADVLTPVRKRG